MKIFILGSQRSGTTLLSMILGSHPEITALDEPISYAFVPCICGNGCEGCKWVNNVKASQPTVITPHSCYKIPKWTHFRDKITAHIDDSFLIFIKRNPLDIVASMLNLKMKNSNWAIAEGYTEAAETLKILNIVELSEELGVIKDNPLKVAIFCVATKYLFSKDCHTINYEELVNQPETTLSLLCEKLNIGWDKKLLHHSELFRGRQIGQTLGERPIDKQSVGKHKKILNKDEIEEIKSYLQYLSNKFSYEEFQQLADASQEMGNSY